MVRSGLLFARVFILILGMVHVPTIGLAQEAADAIAPEAKTPPTSLISAEARQPERAADWMVAAANPLAAQAGAAILRSGGNAADAAVAVQLVLGLVEPQSSGLGGGAFLLYWDAEEQSLTTLDGRETAPMAATPRLFQDAEGEPLKFFDAVVGGRSVGVPGTPMLLWSLHERWGRLPWSNLFGDAIRLANDGFLVSPRMQALIENDRERLSRFDATRAYFVEEALASVDARAPLTNHDYAESLRAFRDDGLAPFYTGAIAADIVDVVRNAPGNPGVLSMADLAAYRVKERPPVCIEYREHDVCGMGPPSSGGLTVGQILGLLRPFDLAAMGPDSPEAWRLIGDASRLAFADRGRYMADSDFVPMPVQGLLDDVYLEERSQLLDQGTGQTLSEVNAGTPEWDHARLQADDESLELPSTSHFVIVDRDGNVVSMTTTIENGFGSRLFVRGFLLNNELTDFSFRSHKDGLPIANRVEPGKRPRSSMAPTIILQDGQPVMAVGSPGGSRIIPYVAKTIIAALDWGLDVQGAIDVPHMVNRFGTYDLEAATSAEEFGPLLEEMGFEVNVRDLTSGIHAIAITSDGLLGAADGRREGIAAGE